MKSLNLAYVISIYHIRKRPILSTGQKSTSGHGEDVSDQSPKKTETTESQAMLIGTHYGTFHCDEALACFMLKQLPEYKDAKIIRYDVMKRIILKHVYHGNRNAIWRINYANRCRIAVRN